MPRGSEDYLNPLYGIAARGLDPAMQALGLFGFTPIDNLGRWFWFDNFRYGLGAWGKGYSVGTGSVELVSEKTYVPSQCVKLSFGSTIGEDYARIYRTILTNIVSRVGYEFAFLNDDWYGYMQADIVAQTTDTLYLPYIRIDGAGYKVEIYTSSGYVTILEAQEVLRAGRWIPIKVVFDLTTGYYVRLYVGWKMYDISSYEIFSTPAEDYPIIGIVLKASPSTVAASNMTVGYFLLTVDEP